MDIKVYNEHINLLCHGCLATDRKVRRIRGVFRKMFQFLRNDDKADVQSRELLLCWECVGFLKKLKMFRARIRKAERTLVTYLHNYYNEDRYTNPQCLSSLKSTHIYTYTHECYEGEKLLHEVANNDNIELKDEEDLMADIKMECNDNIIQQHDYSNDDDSDYYDTELKIEKEDNVVKPSTVKKKIDKNKYEKIAMVTKSSYVNAAENNDTKLKIDKKDDIDKSSRVKKKNNERIATVMKISNVNDAENNDTQLEIDKKDNIDKSSRVKKKNNEKIATVTKSSNVNNTDSKDPELKINKKDNIVKPSTVKKKHNHSGNRYYEKLALVTKRKDIVKKKYFQYTESVCLSQKEYENILMKDIRYYSRKNLTKFKCNKCQLLYFSNLDLLRHISFRHNEQATFPYKCAACDTMITSSEHLDEHWTETHTKMLKCTLCSEVYRTMLEIKDHVYKQHTKNYGCKQCGLEFGMLPDFKNHYKDMHEKVVCDYCNKSFAKKLFLLNHIRGEHIPAYCKLCDRNFKKHKSLNKHNWSNHPELTAGETRKELSYCVECNKQYPSVYKYQRHLIESPRHTPQKKIRVPCPDCGKVFTRSLFMKNHYRLFHLKVTKNHCKECDKYFANGYGLRQHIKRVHEKIALPKDKYCDICGRGFTQKSVLVKHRRTHTGERPYKCSYCPAAFAQITAMKSHQKTQHKNLELTS